MVADFPARALDAESLRECAAVLGDVDAVLLGDSPVTGSSSRPPTARRCCRPRARPPGSGSTPGTATGWRWRRELAALADLGVGAVHCVTGDHPASGGRPDAAAVFDLDSTELTAMAAGRGLIVSVAESPAAPPRDGRPARLLSKEHAGAEVCIVNHCGGVVGGRGVRRAQPRARAARRRWSRASRWSAMPAAPPQLAASASRGSGERVRAIVTAADPRRAGIRAAVQLGRRMLDTGLVAGINLSGGPADGQELAYAEALAEAAEALRR